MTGKRKVNYLEQVPLRNVEYIEEQGQRITLLIPKFKSERLRRILVPRSRSPYIKVRLDELGSLVWQQIDGVKTVGEICELIGHEEAAPEKPISQGHNHSIEERMTRFLSELYKSHFILFR